MVACSSTSGPAAPDTSDESVAIRDLPEAVEASYRDLSQLEAFEAECARPLLHGVERSTARNVVLAMLDVGEKGTRTYDRCTRAWPEHYGIPQVLDAASPDTPTPYVAWAVETGDNLRSRLRRGDALSRRRTLEIGRAVAETLAELHRFGGHAEHLTPASIWLGPAGICQLLGLGLGAPGLEEVGEGQRYRAPERLRREPGSMAERILGGDLGERADVWSLGVILLELLEGRHRLSSRSAEELIREQKEVPWRPPSHIGHELASLLGAMLTLDPLDRTVTAEEVAAQLDDLLIDHQVTAPRGQARSQAGGISSSGPDHDAAPDPPLPIPPRSDPPPDWRQAVRSVQERRRAFEANDGTPAWKIWLLPGLGLALVLLLLWLLLSLRPSV